MVTWPWTKSTRTDRKPDKTRVTLFTRRPIAATIASCKQKHGLTNPGSLCGLSPVHQCCVQTVPAYSQHEPVDTPHVFLSHLTLQLPTPPDPSEPLPHCKHSANINSHIMAQQQYEPCYAVFYYCIHVSINGANWPVQN